MADARGLWRDAVGLIKEAGGKKKKNGVDKRARGNWCGGGVYIWTNKTAG